MPVQVARRRANSRRGSRLGRREKRGRTVNFNAELGRSDGNERSWHNVNYCCSDLQNSLSEMRQARIHRDYRDDSDVKSSDILLVLKILIGGYEYVERRRC